jgi:uncharacterized membrane protein
MNVRKFLTKEQKNDILNAIHAAEKLTSGEIRVHLESKCPGEALERAREVFQQLKMHETHLHNGALIYLAITDRKLAIFGDQGIHEVVEDDYWENVKEKMLKRFKEGAFSEGLCIAIGLIGEKLKEHFPYQDDDINELPDDISIKDED